jgi:hypothetical protein
MEQAPPRRALHIVEPLMDMDIQLHLAQHGWSRCRLFIDTEQHLLIMTHIFSNPLEDLLNALTQLLRFPETEAECTWHDEPGFYHWSFFHEKPELKIHILLGNSHYNKHARSYGEIEFHTTLREFCILVFTQMQKIELLLRSSVYAQDRIEEFPRAACDDFYREVRRHFAIP